MIIPVESFGHYQTDKSQPMTSVICHGGKIYLNRHISSQSLFEMTPKQAIDLAQALVEAAFEGGPESPDCCYGDKYTQIVGCNCEKCEFIGRVLT